MYLARAQSRVLFFNLRTSLMEYAASHRFLLRQIPDLPSKVTHNSRKYVRYQLPQVARANHNIRGCYGVGYC